MGSTTVMMHADPEDKVEVRRDNGLHIQVTSPLYTRAVTIWMTRRQLSSSGKPSSCKASRLGGGAGAACGDSSPRRRGATGLGSPGAPASRRRRTQA